MRCHHFRKQTNDLMFENPLARVSSWVWGSKNMVIIANLFGDHNPWAGKPSETSEIFWNSTSRMTDWFAISSGMTIPPFSEGLIYQSDSDLHHDHDGQNWSDDHGPIHPIFWWHTWKVWTWKLVRKQSSPESLGINDSPMDSGEGGLVVVSRWCT